MIKYNAPPIRNSTVRVLAPMMIACIIAVFAMLLKLRVAALKKNTPSQNYKVHKTGTSVKTFDKVLPVKIHFAMVVAIKYTVSKVITMYLMLIP